MSPRRTALLLVVVGAVLFAVGTVGWAGDNVGLVLSYRWMDHPLLLGGPGLALVASGCVVLVRTTLRRVLAALAGTVVTLAWCGLAATYVVFSPGVDDEYSYRSVEDGSLRTMVLIGGIVDPIWEVRVEQRGRWPNHWHSVGCTASLEGLAWRGRDLVLDTETGDVVVPIDAEGRAGRPSGPPAGVALLHAC
ncbi:hypothetical protein G5V59_09375 [Nocardioides sp. W3-2-3]|uniref:hypothetical protein n=1 Tax=Nocardioides convexus TaxID=2712224 RepID=UPI002418A369|nr:hypothetical protein [Nocardioides convexus]NHA00252.1 hypothetical protein [Nocardioides convexus]